MSRASVENGWAQGFGALADAFFPDPTKQATALYRAQAANAQAANAAYDRARTDQIGRTSAAGANIAARIRAGQIKPEDLAGVFADAFTSGNHDFISAIPKVVAGYASTQPGVSEDTLARIIVGSGGDYRNTRPGVELADATTRRGQDTVAATGRYTADRNYAGDVYKTDNAPLILNENQTAYLTPAQRTARGLPASGPVSGQRSVAAGETILPAGGGAPIRGAPTEATAKGQVIADVMAGTADPERARTVLDPAGGRPQTVGNNQRLVNPVTGAVVAPTLGEEVAPGASLVQFGPDGKPTVALTAPGKPETLDQVLAAAVAGGDWDTYNRAQAAQHAGKNGGNVIKLGPGQQAFDLDGKPIAQVAPITPPTKPLVLKPGEVAVTADGKEIARGPAASGPRVNPPKNVVVSPGQSVVDPDGKVLFQADPKAATPAKPQPSIRARPGDTILSPDGTVLFQAPAAEKPPGKPTVLRGDESDKLGDRISSRLQTIYGFKPSQDVLDEALGIAAEAFSRPGTDTTGNVVAAADAAVDAIGAKYQKGSRDSGPFGLFSRDALVPKQAAAPKPSAPAAAPPAPAQGAAPQRPPNVPAGSAYSPSRQMWRDPQGNLYTADGRPAT